MLVEVADQAVKTRHWLSVFREQRQDISKS